MTKHSIRSCMNALSQYMHAFHFKMLMTLKREIICIIALPQATNEHEASFHLNPENLVIKNLRKYQRLFHNTATFILLPLPPPPPSFSKLCRYKF